MELKKWLKIDIFKFLYYNYFCKRVERNNAYRIYPYKGTKLEIHKGAKIILNGHLVLCHGKVSGSREEAYVQLYENSTLVINGDVYVAYGSMIQAHRDAEIIIGETHINTRATIIADKSISIGNGVLISRDVVIFDSDFHPVLDENGNRTNEASPVILEDHVWVGVKATILRGVTVKTGAVIGANALVTTDVKSNVMVSSMPARGFGYINWNI